MRRSDGIAMPPRASSRRREKLTRNLYLITKGEPEPLEKAFIDFVLSEEGQKIVEELGYIPVQTPATPTTPTTPGYEAIFAVLMLALATLLLFLRGT